MTFPAREVRCRCLIALYCLRRRFSGDFGTTVAAVSVFASMLFSPETKGTKMVADIRLA
jgi:hypothetical protein